MDRRALLFSSAALALSSVLHGESDAKTTEPRRWRHFGVDHAYRSPALAKADAAAVLARAGWPQSAITAMTTAMRSDGETRRIVNGDRLDFMRSGRSALWTNVLVDFINPSEDGMEFTAPAWYWVVQTEEGTFEVFLPRVCNNLAGRWTRRVRARTECAYVLFEARADDAYAVVHVLGRQPPPSECTISVSSTPAPQNGKNFGSVPFVRFQDVVPNRCPTDWVPRHYELDNLEVGSFSVTPGWYAVKVPISLADNPANRVVVCLIKKNGTSTRAMGVQHFDYVLHEPTGRKIATIWYQGTDVPQNYRGTPMEELYFRWTNVQNQCRTVRAS